MRDFIGFHNPDEEYGFLSNWYLSDFYKDGVKYSSMEQYMMHRKALVMGDAEYADRIMHTTDVAAIKQLGKDVRNYNDTIWNGVRQVIIYEGLLEKFRQNIDLREQLLATGDAVLAECAVQDIIWGIGLSMHDKRRFDMSQWRGQNLLGFALMLVREKLAEE
ncbi:MAG: NADAR family protein [Ruminococcaceae bacterium]|nr:NADAR family protein [Oscillospiraceae bacterium]